MDELLQVGIITQTHGIRGEVKVFPTTDDVKRFKKLKETKQIFFFDDLANIKILDMPLAMLRQFKKQVEVGEGYFIRDNECCKIKTPIAYH